MHNEGDVVIPVLWYMSTGRMLLVEISHPKAGLVSYYDHTSGQGSRSQVAELRIRRWKLI